MPEAKQRQPVDPQRLHLVTCAGVVHDLALLDHFIRHYRGLGVPTCNMHVILNADDAAEPALEQATDILEAHGIEPVEVWIATYTSDSMWQRRRDVQRVCVPQDHWLISADVDEFHEYPCDLTRFLAICEDRGVNCVDGVFIDRMAPDGALVSPEAGQSPDLTFPVRRVLQGSTFEFRQYHGTYGCVKIMAAAGSLLLVRGGHATIEELETTKYLFGLPLGAFPAAASPRFRARVPLRVHHFKWTASLRESLESRLSANGVSVAGKEYGQQILDHLAANNMRINLAGATRVRSFAPWWQPSGMRAIEQIRLREKRRRKRLKKIRKLRRKIFRLKKRETIA